MMVIAVVADAVHRPRARAGRAAGLPAGDRRQRRLPALAVAADDPRPGAARRGQRGRARVLRRRAGGQDASAARPRRPTRFAAKAHAAARRERRAPAGSAACSTRCSRRCPASACSPCWPSACSGSSSGATDPGDVVTVAYLLTIVAFPIRSLGWLLGEFPRSVVGFERVQAVLDATGEMAYGDRDARRATAPVPGSTYAASAYRYADGPPLLHDLTLHRRARPDRRGRRRHRPAASRTLTSLLLRLVDPDEGEVLLDGLDLRDLAPRRAGRARRAGAAAGVPVRRHACAATSRSAPTCPTTTVWAALRTAQADGFVAALPDGLDTRLGERGTTLSGGQRQRLSLARALVRRPRLLVMDDATSAVDPEVEARILAGAARRGRRTTRRVRRGRLPQGHDRAGRRGRLPRGRPHRRPGHPRASCWPATPATPTWSTPTSRRPSRRR